MENEYRQLSCRISIEVYKRLKVYSATSGLRIQALVQTALEEFLIAKNFIASEQTHENKIREEL